jgi:hypothetical protein
MTLQQPLSEELLQELDSAIQLAIEARPLIQKAIAAGIPTVEDLAKQIDEVEKQLIAIQQQFPRA